MSDESGSLLEFPCDLPVKVFGRNEQQFRDAALAIVRTHYAECSIAEQESRQGSKFIVLSDDQSSTTRFAFRYKVRH